MMAMTTSSSMRVKRALRERQGTGMEVAVNMAAGCLMIEWVTGGR